MMQRQSSFQPMMMNYPTNPMMMNYPNANRLLGRTDNMLVSGYRIGTTIIKIRAVIAMIISIVMISVGTYLVVTHPKNKDEEFTFNEITREYGWGLIGVGCVLFLGSLVYLYLYRTMKQEQQYIM